MHKKNGEIILIKYNQLQKNNQECELVVEVLAAKAGFAAFCILKNRQDSEYESFSVEVLKPE